MFIELLRSLDPNAFHTMLTKEHTLLIWAEHNFITKYFLIFTLSRTIRRTRLYKAFHCIRRHAVLEKMVTSFYRRVTRRTFVKMNSDPSSWLICDKTPSNDSNGVSNLSYFWNQALLYLRG